MHAGAHTHMRASTCALVQTARQEPRLYESRPMMFVGDCRCTLLYSRSHESLRALPRKLHPANRA
eukprot:5386197-Pleurochrysis_carterae.AAC.2